MNHVKGFCVLDVDGTLIEEEVIDLLGREANCEEKITQITRRAMSGELDFATSLKERVALLEGLPITVFEQVLQSIHLSKNAQEFISILQNNEILVGLVSGGFIPIVELIAKKFKLNYYEANQLEVKDGYLTGRLVGNIVTPQRKKEILEKWRDFLGLSKERTIAIGDGANDLLMLKTAGLGIAFCAKDIVKSQITVHIDKRDFFEVLPLIDFLK